MSGQESKARGGSSGVVAANGKEAADPKKSVALQAASSPELSAFRSSTMQACATVFILCFSIYSRTVFRYVSGGDSGELVVAACNLAVPHPPGYPLFTLIARLFLYLVPFGTMAYRVNIASTVLASLAAAFLTGSVCHVTRNIPVGVLAGFLYAFSPTIWLYAIQAEVFALNNCLCSALLYLGVRFFDNGALLAAIEAENAPPPPPTPVKTEPADSDSAAQPTPTPVPVKPQVEIPPSPVVLELKRKLTHIAYAGSFVCGLCMSNQHTTVFYVGAAVLGVVHSLNRFKLLNPNSIGLLFFWMFLGVAPYAYLPWAAQFQPMDSWGDQRTVKGFLRHFLRQEYGTFRLATDSLGTDPGPWRRVLLYFSQLVFKETLYVFSFFSLIGLYALWTRAEYRLLRPLQFVMAFGWSAYMIVFHYLANLSIDNPAWVGVQARFWMQANLYVFFWIGVGFHYVALSLWNHMTSDTVGLSSQPAKIRFSSSHHYLSKALWAVAILASFLQCQLHYSSRDYHEDDVLQKVYEGLLRGLPHGSILLPSGDLNQNIVKYAQQCENVRPDVHIISFPLSTWEWFVPMLSRHYPGVSFPGEAYISPHVENPYNFKQFLDANLHNHTVVLCGTGPSEYGDNSYVGHYDVVPFGLCGEFVRVNEEKKPILNLTRWRQGLETMPPRSSIAPFITHRHTDDTWEHAAYDDQITKRLFLAAYFSAYASALKTDIDMLRLARDANDYILDPSTGFEESTKGLNKFKPEHYRDAGVIFAMWSAIIRPTNLTESLLYERRMIVTWRKYLKMNPHDAEVKQYVEQRVHPWLANTSIVVDWHSEFS